jgi:hypothetical protein
VDWCDSANGSTACRSAEIELELLASRRRSSGKHLASIAGCPFSSSLKHVDYTKFGARRRRLFSSIDQFLVDGPSSNKRVRRQAVVRKTGTAR